MHTTEVKRLNEHTYGKHAHKACLHTHTHTHTHTHSRAHTQTYTHILQHTHAYTHTYSSTHTNTHTHSQGHTQTHTYTHIHTYDFYEEYNIIILHQITLFHFRWSKNLCLFYTHTVRCEHTRTHTQAR